jgi:predicted pyridoxine 5'-phosphate oxidase superfamily flavin-nucleotide-binding protein
MSHRFAQIAFTPAVQAEQEKHGSRRQYVRMQAQAGPNNHLGAVEAEFLEQADSFYLASVSESGWPYVQHRGGPRGFLKVLSPSQLAFADFRGNRQYVSAGNAAADDRVSSIVVDYAHRRRLKLFGHLRFIDVADAEAALVDAVTSPAYAARVERVAVIDVEAFDWNCPQHITQRFTLEQIEEAVHPLRARIAELEDELSALRAQRVDAL